MSPRSRRIAFRAHTIAVAIALFAALMFHIVVPVLAWQWVQLPFLGALLGPSLVVSAVEDDWAGAAAGLQPQDRIIAVNQSPTRRRQDLLAITMSLSPDEPVVLKVTTSNQVMYDGNIVTLNRVESIVKSALAKSDVPVIMQVERGALAGIMVQVMDRAKIGGATKISVTAID